MAVIQRIEVNGQVVRTFEAVRTTNLSIHGGFTDPDTTNTYKWRAFRGDGTSSTSCYAQGFIDHRYGDGVVMLMEKVLIDYMVDHGTIDVPEHWRR